MPLSRVMKIMYIPEDLYVLFPRVVEEPRDVPLKKIS